MQVAAVGLERLHATNVHVPQVHGRSAVHDPLGQHLAGTSGRLHADGVEAGGHPVVAEFGRLAQQVAVVGGERFGAVEEQADAHVCQDRDALAGRLVDWGQVFPVLVQLQERLVGGQPAHAVGLGHRLEGADHEAAGLGLHVDAPVLVSKHREAGRQALDRFGHEVEVLAGMQGDVHAHVAAQLVGPHAGSGHHVLGIHRTLVGLHPDGPTAFGADSFHRHTLEDPGAPFPGHRGQRHGRVYRRGLAVPGNPGAADDALRVQQRPAGDQVLGRDDVDLHVEGAGHAGAPYQLLHALRVVCHAERSDLLESRGMTHVAFEGLIEFGRVGGQAGHVLGGPKAPDEAGGVPGGAAGQRVAFQ